MAASRRSRVVSMENSWLRCCRGGDGTSAARPRRAFFDHRSRPHLEETLAQNGVANLTLSRFDPAEAKGTDAEQMLVFIRVRDEIEGASRIS